MSWLLPVATVVGGIISSAGVAALVNAVAGRRTVKVDAADRLTDSALEWAQALKADADSARQDAAESRREAAEARRDANEARREATEARREAAEANREMRRLIRLIHDPYVTLDRLRALVPQPGANGTGGDPP